VDKIVLIVAGGSGIRMNAGIPKQFIPVNGFPILMHTMEVFASYDRQIRIILALPDNQMEAWRQLCKTYKYSRIHEIRPGGATRFHTVQKNLQDLPDNSLIAIHDGVRPLVSYDTIDRCFKAASEFGNAIPCVEIPETLRKIEADLSRSIDRTQYRLVQTPQIFKGGLIKKAYEQDYQKHFTDDAGVVESLGYKIHVVEGNPENIKITFEKDLVIASALLNG
jgi:2-C-methyl-D-erythritol 4-phosphate cytidylyltransferase